MSKSWSSMEERAAYAGNDLLDLEAKEEHAIAAHDDEALETHETEDFVEPECLHRWTLVRLCDYCGEEERVFTDPGSVP